MGRRDMGAGKGATPADRVKKLMKKGKVKKKCCRSKSACKKCPVLALKRVKAEMKKAA
ncbi:hypothetical protein SAMN05192558_10866 [Actinokineospora alba]|uniref:Uncharacterized protein n=2 Tax=Actinokineospora TaxID=39845 RepID=A0A1H0RR26_9PSEU|nr:MULTISPECIES: hypothetical protein [Actinokineospora]MBC6451539.1 hypothetical protein [Actinokineospora xionganensis]TDP66974.1 hypothetical protein C8E96_2493 [Actinokineospora alba]SDJ32685.1 hypothetical protein SAMN05421871_11366 [Actinokineospora alba]SDP31448.1 hypothetical protein SAMN05192558_10866 [Actinokineospora alba]